MDIEAQATRWLVRLDAKSSPELIAQHEKWMAQSTRHRVAYMRLSVAWKRLDILRRMRPLDPPDKVDPDLLDSRPALWPGGDRILAAFRSAWLSRLGIGVAIVALFAVIGAALFERNTQITYSTPIGGQLHIILDDGSTLDLNTNTRLRVQFTATQRQIFLDRGEVLLNVAHDTSRPMEVIASGVITRAVGTKFSVRVYDNANVETLVTEGRVLVLQKQSIFGVPTTPTPLVRTLVAGERVLVDSRGAHVKRLSENEIERSLQWTTGRISFHQSLSEVVRELNRYSTRQLVILDPRLSETKVGVTFETADADAYVDGLLRFYGAKALGSSNVPRQ